MQRVCQIRVYPDRSPTDQPPATLPRQQEVVVCEHGERHVTGTAGQIDDAGVVA